MKKLLLMLLAMIVMPAFAQNDYQYRISLFMSDDGFRNHTYQYSSPTGTDFQGVH